MSLSYKLLPPNTVSKEIFRAYDIRGVVDETLTSDAVYTLGRAIGSQIREQNENNVLVARDGRLSGPTLIAALKQGLVESGCEVIDLGAVPTPLLYFATNVLSATSGVMLTGSHNPVNHNGLKIVIKGQTLAEQEIYALYDRIQAQNFITGTGSSKSHDIIPAYIKYICQDVKLTRPLRVVVDAGNGIMGAVAPQLLQALGCDVIPLFCEVDGNFPNHHPDPSVPENLQDLIQAVQQHKADVGLAFDGDGDRLGVVTNEGEIIWPDRQLMLYAIDVLKRQPGAQIIFDVKCSSHLPQVIAQHGGQPLMWKTGHSLVKAKLKEIGAPLAGEMSGHIFFKERWFGFDDGLYTAARLLEILAIDMRSSNAVFAALPNSVNTPELKLMLPDERKFLFMAEFQKTASFLAAKVTTIDGLRADFPFGFGLVRCSNTTPCLVLRFEADNAENLKIIQMNFREQLLKLDRGLILPF